MENDARAAAHANLGGVDEAIRRSLSVSERARGHEALGGFDAALRVSMSPRSLNARDAGLPNRPDLMPLARAVSIGARAAQFAIGRIRDFSRLHLRHHAPLTSSGRLRVVSRPVGRNSERETPLDGSGGCSRGGDSAVTAFSAAAVSADRNHTVDHAAAAVGASLRLCLGPLDALRLHAIDGAIGEALLAANRRGAGESMVAVAPQPLCSRNRQGVAMREEGAFGGALHGEWIVIDAAVECRQSELVDPSELTRAALGLLSVAGPGGTAAVGIAPRRRPGSVAATADGAPTPAPSLPPAHLQDATCMARVHAQFAIDLPRLRMFVNGEPLPPGTAPAKVAARLRTLLGAALGDEVLALSTQGALAPLLCWVCKHYAAVDRDVHVVDGGCEEVRVLCTGGDGGAAPTVELVLMKPFRVIQLESGDAKPVTELLTVTHLMLSPWRGGNATISVPVAPADVDWELETGEERVGAAAAATAPPTREQELPRNVCGAEGDDAGAFASPQMYGSWQLVNSDDFEDLQHEQGEAVAVGVAVEA